MERNENDAARRTCGLETDRNAYANTPHLARHFRKPQYLRLGFLSTRINRLSLSARRRHGNPRRDHQSSRKDGELATFVPISIQLGGPLAFHRLVRCDKDPSFLTWEWLKFCLVRLISYLYVRDLFLGIVSLGNCVLGEWIWNVAELYNGGFNWASFVSTCLFRSSRVAKLSWV